jgi:hypothetical protein
MREAGELHQWSCTTRRALGSRRDKGIRMEATRRIGSPRGDTGGSTTMSWQSSSGWKVALGGPFAALGYVASSEPAHEERWLVRRADDGERRREKQGTGGSAYRGGQESGGGGLGYEGRVPF